MTLEEDLRLTLLDRAEKLPAPRPDLLVGVRAGVRRSNYGRAAVGVAAVVAAAIAVAGTENPVRAGQAAGSYSWRSPPSRSRRRMRARASVASRAVLSVDHRHLRGRGSRGCIGGPVSVIKVAMSRPDEVSAPAGLGWVKRNPSGQPSRRVAR
jgi:hypothetical protein